MKQTKHDRVSRPNSDPRYSKVTRIIQHEQKSGTLITQTPCVHLSFEYLTRSAVKNVTKKELIDSSTLVDEFNAKIAVLIFQFYYSEFYTNRLQTNAFLAALKSAYIANGKNEDRKLPVICK